MLLTCTGAGTALIDSARWSLVGTLRRVTTRPLLVVDIAVPRNVDPRRRELRRRHPARTSTTCATGPPAGCRSVPARPTTCARSSAKRSSASSSRRTARQAAPLVASLHEQPSSPPAELERFAHASAGLDDRQREAVEALTRGIVAKLLHQPSVRLKDDAGTPQGERNAAAVRDLFDLG